MSCIQCNKPFTCGCQKHPVGDGKNIHKTCATEYNKLHSFGKANNLNLELAEQQIKNLRNKQDGGRATI